MYLGMPPYGHSLFNGGYMPPYNVPFSGSSGHHYNYGNRLSTGSPFRPLPFSAPLPFSSGSMICNGGLYGLPPIMDHYGMGIPVAQLQGAKPVFFPDDKPLSKDSARDNGWTCPNCGNVNFSFRPVCNMRKCNTTRPGSQPAKADKNSRQIMPDGSWKCDKCNNINYLFRSKCNRQNCGADKPSNSNESVSPAQGEYEQDNSEF